MHSFGIKAYIIKEEEVWVDASNWKAAVNKAAKQLKRDFSNADHIEIKDVESESGHQYMWDGAAQ